LYFQNKGHCVSENLDLLAIFLELSLLKCCMFKRVHKNLGKNFCPNRQVGEKRL